MAINPDIRDQAYQFFIEEAPELLQAIETGLLTLRQERDTPKVHAIMRAAHSLKGGAASVELDAITTLAHRLENIFKALYNDTIDIDTDLESQLLQAYDCLRLPLMEQIATGSFDAEQALALAEPIFAQIEERLGDALTQADNYIPSSSELGIDMALSIFEVDVAQGLEHLAHIIAHPQGYEVAGELRAQAEVFSGFAELMNQPGFGAIATATIAALDANPDYVLEIAELALIDFQIGRQAVLAAAAKGAGSSATPQQISPCAALVALANSGNSKAPHVSTPIATHSSTPQTTDTLCLVEDVFGSEFETLDVDEDEFPTAELVQETQTSVSYGALEDIFSNALELFEELPVAEVPQETQTDSSPQTLADIFDIFSESLEDLRTAEVRQETQTDSSPQTLAEILDICAEEVFGSTELPAPAEPETVQVELVAEATFEPEEIPETLEEAVQSIGEIFEALPELADLSVPESGINLTSPSANLAAISQEATLVSAKLRPEELVAIEPASQPTVATSPEINLATPESRPTEATPTPRLTVRVDSERLERMNNVVGELAINRNGLSLHNEQLQRSVRELLNRFVRVQSVVGNLQELSYQMLVTPERDRGETLPPLIAQLGELASRQADFDSLELDRYGVLSSRLQGLLEDMVQLEESVDDIVLFARATDQSLEQQRQMLTQLRDELIWARMLPLGEVLNRFPRVLRDLSTRHHKSVNLKLSGTSVLVDKAVLEKLYDPLLHLLRNAFDHGIESPQQRRDQGKPEQGQIEIRAYHQGSQTIIEVKDDGQGLNTERIRNKALELGFLTPAQLATTSNNRLHEFIFEAGFSTAARVSELSGRGVGLDVVRSQMRSLKGTIHVTSLPGVGTTFTLRLPLTLTIAKLLVCFVGSTALALPSDGVEEIVVPKADQVKESGTQRFLQWRGQVVPAYRLSELLDYNCPLPDTSPSKALIAVPSPQNWALPMLLLRQEQHVVALEIDRLVTEQELVIKPFGEAIAPPSFTYGCTILGDGSLIPVLDGAVLLDRLLGQNAVTDMDSSPRGTSQSLPASFSIVAVDSTPIAMTGSSDLALQGSGALAAKLLPDSVSATNPDSMGKATKAADVAQVSVSGTRPDSTNGATTKASEQAAHQHSAGSSTKENSSVRKFPTPFKTIKTPTVLIVDDAVALRRTLALTLERAGYQVLQARDGREAIEQLQRSTSSVKLVVCDVEMPNMNGFEFLSYRRQDPDMAKIPVAMLTSRSNDKHRWLAMHLGANAYFTKPYLEQEFVAAIKEIIAGGTPQQQPALQPTY